MFQRCFSDVQLRLAYHLVQRRQSAGPVITAGCRRFLDRRVPRTIASPAWRLASDPPLLLEPASEAPDVCDRIMGATLGPVLFPKGRRLTS